MRRDDVARSTVLGLPSPESLPVEEPKPDRTPPPRRPSGTMDAVTIEKGFPSFQFQAHPHHKHVTTSEGQMEATHSRARQARTGADHVSQPAWDRSRSARVALRPRRTGSLAFLPVASVPSPSSPHPRYCIIRPLSPHASADPIMPFREQRPGLNNAAALRPPRRALRRSASIVSRGSHWSPRNHSRSSTKKGDRTLRDLAGRSRPRPSPSLPTVCVTRRAAGRVGFRSPLPCFDKFSIGESSGISFPGR